jgi:hypothetical protein
VSTRRDFFKQSAAAGLLVSLSNKGVGKARANVETPISSSKLIRSSQAKIKSLVRREETVLRYQCKGDNWHMSWASDDRQYVSLCVGAGIANPPKVFHNSRMLAITGGPNEAKFNDLPGYPKLARPAQRDSHTRYYNYGTLALDGYLYQFLSTFDRSPQHGDLQNNDPNDLLRFVGAKLIYSPDNGRTWRNQNGSTPVVWESWGQRSRDTMVFYKEDQEAFSLLTVLQMGKNYEQNRDGYLYVYAPNGNAEGTMNELVMFRVPKNKVLDRDSYEYFAGRHADSLAKWTKNIRERAPVHTFPRGWVNSLEHPYAWHPSIAYNAPLNLYLMANWGMGCTSGGMWFEKPSYLGFWVSAEPWGPWRQVHEETAWLPAGDPNARAYQPQISPKWMAPDGKSFWLVWTDYQGADSDEVRRFAEKYGRKEEMNAAGEADLIEGAALMDKHMPNYRFNTQRVDLIVG